ncbi:MAG TPA: response regulator transcription factor [Polyangia bacterium]
MALRVVLVEDEAFIRRGLRQMLERAPGLAVVGEAADGWPAVHLCRQVRPDLVLMDLHLPGLSGFEAIRLLTRESPPIRCLAMSSVCYAEWVIAAFKAGARGFLP